MDLSLAMAVADPVQDLCSPLKGPFRAKPLAMPDAAAAALKLARLAGILPAFFLLEGDVETRSEEHKYELQSLMSNSYAVFCLKKKKIHEEHIIESHN